MFDILTVWPRHVDYPPFRLLMTENRLHYWKLIVDFTGIQASPVERYVRDALPHALFTAPARNEHGDWRHEAVTRGLALSDARYVLFLEQDFLVCDPDLFFGRLREVIVDGRMLVGFEEHGRLHPACLLVRRDLLDRTSRDFSADGVGRDHFWRVAAELREMTDLVTLEALGLERGRDWCHMAGLTHNYNLVQRGESVTYRPVEFALYNLVALRVGSCPDFEALMERCVNLAPVEALLFGGIA